MPADETGSYRVQRETKNTMHVSVEVSVIVDAREASLSVLSAAVGLQPVVRWSATVSL